MARRTSSIQPLSPHRRRSPLSRLIVFVVLAIALIVGGLWFLSTLAREQPLQRIEQPVANDALIR